MKVPTDLFTWHKDTRQFVTEASNLGIGNPTWPKVITVYNPKTGGEVDFHYRRGNHNAEDLISVEYISGTLGLFIFND